MKKHSEKIKEGLARAATRGRKPGAPRKVSNAQIVAAIPLGTTKGAAKVKLSVSTFIRRRRAIEEGAESV